MPPLSLCNPMKDHSCQLTAKTKPTGQDISSLKLLEELPAFLHLSSVSFLLTATSSWEIFFPLKLSTKNFLTR